MTTTPTDIPLRVTTRPTFKQLSSAENEEFLRRQAEFEAAYRSTGDPQVLWDALLTSGGRGRHARLGGIGHRQRPDQRATDEAAERYRDRMRHVQRYIVVRDLRSKDHTKDSALDEAVDLLAEQQMAACDAPRRAVASRRTIEEQLRQGRE